MANLEHVKQLQQGVDHWKIWRAENPHVQPDLSGASLSKANLSKANLSGADLIEADLSGANLLGANLSEAYLIEANLSKADLSGVNLFEANLNKANLSLAELSKAYLPEADLSGANLFGANLSGAYLIEADFYKAKLRKANLSEANLSKANLSEAYLIEANLSGAYLIETDLHKANLSKADLYKANLHKANMNEAILSKTNLSKTYLNLTKLSGADLSEASLYGTTIAKNDLRTTKGLTKIHYRGPSHIELFSVQLPQDGSALHFLRGVGVPDEWIDFYRAYMMRPIQYYSCFIAYSSKDELLAKRLHADLQAEGVRCWFAPEDMKIGDRIRQRIDEAIHLQDKLLLLLSQHSLVSSWVRDEVEAAFEKERRQQRDVLFPIRLDEMVMQTGESWAATLRRSCHIGDFSQWENTQAYQKAFTRLLRDLKQS